MARETFILSNHQSVGVACSQWQDELDGLFFSLIFLIKSFFMFLVRLMMRASIMKCPCHFHYKWKFGQANAETWSGRCGCAHGDKSLAGFKVGGDDDASGQSIAPPHMSESGERLEAAVQKTVETQILLPGSPSSPAAQMEGSQEDACEDDILVVRRALERERQKSDRLRQELEHEREGAESAAQASMIMIQKLQKEKAEASMQATQATHKAQITVEKAVHDEEALKVMSSIIAKQQHEFQKQIASHQAFLLAADRSLRTPVTPASSPRPVSVARLLELQGLPPPRINLDNSFEATTGNDIAVLSRKSGEVARVDAHEAAACLADVSLQCLPTDEMLPYAPPQSVTLLGDSMEKEACPDRLAGHSMGVEGGADSSSGPTYVCLDEREDLASGKVLDALSGINSEGSSEDATEGSFQSEPLTECTVHVVRDPHSAHSVAGPRTRSPELEEVCRGHCSTEPKVEEAAEIREEKSAEGTLGTTRKQEPKKGVEEEAEEGSAISQTACGEPVTSANILRIQGAQTDSYGAAVAAQAGQTERFLMAPPAYSNSECVKGEQRVHASTEIDHPEESEGILPPRCPDEGSDAQQKEILNAAGVEDGGPQQCLDAMAMQENCGAVQADSTSCRQAVVERTRSLPLSPPSSHVDYSRSVESGITERGAAEKAANHGRRNLGIGGSNISSLVKKFEMEASKRMSAKAARLPYAGSAEQFSRKMLGRQTVSTFQGGASVTRHISRPILHASHPGVTSCTDASLNSCGNSEKEGEASGEPEPARGGSTTGQRNVLASSLRAAEGPWPPHGPGLDCAVGKENVENGRDCRLPSGSAGGTGMGVTRMSQSPGMTTWTVKSPDLSMRDCGQGEHDSVPRNEAPKKSSCTKHEVTGPYIAGEEGLSNERPPSSKFPRILSQPEMGTSY